jgi:hypothetical protein
MIAMPITVSGIDGMRLVLTDTGENGSIQHQPSTPETRPWPARFVYTTRCWSTTG